MYLNGHVDIFDIVDIDMFIVVALNMMVVQLGYTGESEPLFYYYLRLLTSLDEGLYALACEEDVRCLSTLVRSFKLIEVYIEYDKRTRRMHTRQETQNLGLKAITDKNGPVPIRFKFGDRETLMPHSNHATHWANYLGELVRELPLHYPSWQQMLPERNTGVMAKIKTELTTWSASGADVPHIFSR
nr:hypothetical protein [Tanacetum cinerariifolium]